MHAMQSYQRFILFLLCIFAALAASAAPHISRFHFHVDLPAAWSVETFVGAQGEWREWFSLDERNGVVLYATDEGPYTRKTIADECGPPPKVKSFDPQRCTHATRNEVLYLSMDYGMQSGSHTWTAVVPGVPRGRLVIAASSEDVAHAPAVRAMFERLVDAATKEAAPRRDIAP
jgi:hypothetical protein